MFRTLLNRLLESGGLWFATMMVHLMSAIITSIVCTIIAITIEWFGKST